MQGQENKNKGKKGKTEVLLLPFGLWYLRINLFSWFSGQNEEVSLSISNVCVHCAVCDLGHPGPAVFGSKLRGAGVKRKRRNLTGTVILQVLTSVTSLPTSSLLFSGLSSFFSIQPGVFSYSQRNGP